jgi:tetratricopeptide (TPR) repeat protein
MSTPAGLRSDLPVRRRRRLLVAAVLLAGLTLAAGRVGWLWYAGGGPGPPAVRPDGLEPAVGAAVEKARAAVRRSPRSAAAWGRLGMVLLAHQFHAEAEPCFVRAEQLDPRDPRWPYHLGVIRSLHDPDAAILRWRRAVELGGDAEATLRCRLADVLLAQGRTDEARAQFEDVLRREPPHPLAHLGLARVAFEQEDLPASRAHLEQCLDNPCTRKAAQALQAVVSRGLGDVAWAERQAQAAAGLPDDAVWPNPFAEEVARLRADRRSRLQWAEQLLGQGRVPEGIGVLEDLVRGHPDFDPAWRALGFTLLQQGDYRGAEHALGVALRLAPDSAEVHYYLGCLALNRERHAEAEAQLGEAIRLKPDYALAHYNLGQALKVQGNRAGAIDAFRAAVRCRPYLARAHESLGELLAEDGQTEEAIAHLRHAIDLNPANEEPRKLLGRLRAGAGPGKSDP